MKWLKPVITRSREEIRNENIAADMKAGLTFHLQYSRRTGATHHELMRREGATGADLNNCRRLIRNNLSAM